MLYRFELLPSLHLVVIQSSLSYSVLLDSSQQHTSLTTRSFTTRRHAFHQIYHRPLPRPPERMVLVGYHSQSELSCLTSTTNSILLPVPPLQQKNSASPSRPPARRRRPATPTRPTPHQVRLFLLPYLTPLSSFLPTVPLIPLKIHPLPHPVTSLYLPLPLPPP